LAEWLFEAGIGEDRAILVENDHIIEAAIERHEGLRVGGLRVGGVHDARRKGPDRAMLSDGTEIQLIAAARVTQGAAMRVEIVREVIPEPGRTKLARGIPTDAAPCPAPDLLMRITATSLPVRQPRPHEADAFEAAGWSELLDEAMSGEIVFPIGALRLSPTPAMTLFDVDGAAPLDTLSVAAAQCVARAIRRHGIGGSIGIDFPTLQGKAARQAVDEAIEAGVPPPFERTAMNGFGFVQIVRPRPRASIPEIVRSDPIATAACAALRSLERIPAGAPRTMRLPPAVLAYLTARPTWLEELARRTGVAPHLESQ
jgi:ribonuclease G